MYRAKKENEIVDVDKVNIVLPPSIILVTCSTGSSKTQMGNYETCNWLSYLDVHSIEYLREVKKSNQSTFLVLSFTLICHFF
jgi:hypothetical protein